MTIGIAIKRIHLYFIQTLKLMETFLVNLDIKFHYEQQFNQSGHLCDLRWQSNLKIRMVVFNLPLQSFRFSKNPISYKPTEHNMIPHPMSITWENCADNKRCYEHHVNLTLT